MAKKSAFVDNEDLSFATWCSDEGVDPDTECDLCNGERVYLGQPCACMVEAAFEADPSAAALTFAVPDCPRCGGDGEDLNGYYCPCLLVEFMCTVIGDNPIVERSILQYTQLE